MAESKRYSGRSLEEAMGKVNEALGPGAEIVEAKRVRRGGVLGLMKRDVVEVVARPRPARAPGADRARPSERPRAARAAAVDLTAQPRPEARGGNGTRASSATVRRTDLDEQLSSLIDEVDLREERQLLQRPAAAPAAGRSGRRFTDEDLVPLAPEPQARRVARAGGPPRRDGAVPRARSAARPGPAGVPRGSAGAGTARTSMPRRPGMRDPARPYAPVPAAVATQLDDLDDVAPSAAEATPHPHSGATHTPVRAGAAPSQEIDLRERRYGPAWSEEALRDLGLPDAVLELMPVAVLRGDLEWTVALEAAIRASVPAPTMPVAMCGYGVHSAVKILESMLGGCAMGEMRLQDRSVMATPFEIALAVRQCLSQ